MKTGKPLSVRLTNILRRMGLKTRDQMEKAVRNKILHPSNPNAFGLGWKTYRELLTHLGFPLPISSNEVHKERSLLAALLKRRGRTVVEIALIMRFRSREDARRHIASGERKGTLKVLKNS